MRVTTARAHFGVLKKDESCEKVLGHNPTIFQIETDTQEEYDKVMSMIESLL